MFTVRLLAIHETDESLNAREFSRFVVSLVPIYGVENFISFFYKVLLISRILDKRGPQENCNLKSCNKQFAFEWELVNSF